MPFIAKHKLSGVRIDITTIPNPKAVLNSGDYVCPLCASPLIVRGQHYRQGGIVHSHFAHQSDCVSEYDAHPESPEHLLGKIFLRERLHGFYDHYATVQIELEVPAPMEWRDKGRIADIMVTWPMGWREVHEVQLAPITPKVLEERTYDYQRAGLDVTWWLGKRADTQINREWSQNRFGETLGIEFGGDTHHGDSDRDERIGI